MISSEYYEILFRENYSKLSDSARIVWWKYNDLGYNDNIYTSQDLLHDLFFSFKKSVEKDNIYEFNDLDHFFAFCYIRMKSLYYSYLKKKWNRSKREKTYFRELGYTYESVDIINSIFDYEVNESKLKNFRVDDVLEAINSIDNEEHRRILLLKRQDAEHEKICKHFNYTRQELRNKLFDARNKLFKKLKQLGIIDKGIEYKDFIGNTTKKGEIRRKIEGKHLYNKYPFESSYEKKIEFVINKNKGKINLDLLPEIIKYNENHSLSKDNRSAINYALEKVISNKSCFILDGIIYLK